MKPSVSAGARDSATVSRDPGSLAAGQALAEAICATGRWVMVQPFLEAVAREGEFSVVCIRGEPMHAVLKRPAPGDWRVQPQHGGSAARVPLTEGLAASATAALRAATDGDPESLLYARVDTVQDRPGGLIELELVEPALFMRHSAATVERLAAAIAESLVEDVRS